MRPTNVYWVSFQTVSVSEGLTISKSGGVMSRSMSRATRATFPALSVTLTMTF